MLYDEYGLEHGGYTRIHTELVDATEDEQISSSRYYDVCPKCFGDFEYRYLTVFGLNRKTEKELERK
jgi:hypothetical protein